MPVKLKRMIYRIAFLLASSSLLSILPFRAFAQSSSPPSPNVICEGACDFIQLPKKLLEEPKPIQAINTSTGQPIEISFNPNYIAIGNVRVKKSAIRALSSFNLSDYRLRVHGLPANTNIAYTLYFVGNSGKLTALQYDITDPGNYYNHNAAMSDWYPTLLKTEVAPRIRDCGEVLFSGGRTSTSLPPKPGACASGIGIPTTEELEYLDVVRSNPLINP